jgi:hypothetical protein
MSKDYTIIYCDEEPSYRYLLDVQTGARTAKIAAVVQLNPSTADSAKSDPTIGKVSCWAAANGFGCVLFLNLFGIRGTNPASLIGRSYLQLVGPRNDAVSAAAIQHTGTIIFAWGDIDRTLQQHYRQRLSDIRSIIGGKAIHGVGAATAAGFPRHGLMWNSPHRRLRPLSWNTL